METTERQIVKSVNMTDDERKALINFVEQMAIGRKQNIGKLNAADFFSGAMAAMYALGMEPPTGWVIGIMTSRSEMYGMGKK